MSETKGTTGNPTSEKEELSSQDPELASSEEKGSTSQKTTDLTPEMEKIVTDRINALQGDVGRKLADVERREKAITEKEAEQKSTQWEIDVWGIANEKKVEAQALKDRLSELGITDKAKVPLVADMLVGASTTFNPDKGETSGGGGTGKRPSIEELQASTPFETDKKVKSGEWVL